MRIAQIDRELGKVQLIARDDKCDMMADEPMAVVCWQTIRDEDNQAVGKMALEGILMLGNCRGRIAFEGIAKHEDALLAEDLACGQIISVRKEGRHMLSFDVFQGIQRRLEYLLDIVAEHTHHGVSDIGAIV